MSVGGMVCSGSMEALGALGRGVCSPSQQGPDK